jgi:nucleotide-binding universal stress UspA family protein
MITPLEERQAMPVPGPALDELHIHRLLVAVDGSQTAELALRAAVTAAHRDHAAVTLLVVVPDFFVEASRWPMVGAPDPASLQAEADDAAWRLLRETVDRMPADVPLTTVLRRGKPGPEICAQARERGDYDAILLGARGVGRIGSLMGSVSSYVLSHAETAVFVAHPPRKAG